VPPSLCAKDPESPPLLNVRVVSRVLPNLHRERQSRDTFEPSDGIARTCTKRSEVPRPPDDAPMAWASAQAVVRRGGIDRFCTESTKWTEYRGGDDAPMAWASAQAVVRRGGIEPPTRGFSVRPEITDLPEEKAVPNVPWGGSGAVTDPDEAVRTAIKAAIDAGRLELAARLLDVLQEAPKPGAVVRLETLKRAR
jgi:hypothetical protein